MTGQIGEFIAKVLKTLHDNGYPEKRVALPLEKMYELAAKQGYSFNKVLDFLKEKEGIDHEKTTEKIVFFPVSSHGQADAGRGFPHFDPSVITNMMKDFDPDKLQDSGLGNMMLQAAEMLKNMPPEQIEQIRSMVENLSDEEKEELRKKAKGFGFPS